MNSKYTVPVDQVFMTERANMQIYREFFTCNVLDELLNVMFEWESKIPNGFYSNNSIVKYFPMNKKLAIIAGELCWSMLEWSECKKTFKISQRRLTSKEKGSDENKYFSDFFDRF